MQTYLEQCFEEYQTWEHGVIDDVLPQKKDKPEVVPITASIIEGWKRVQSYGCTLTPWQEQKMRDYYNDHH